MDPVDINTVIGVAIGYLLAAFIRYLARTRFWSQIRIRAQGALEDPRIPVDDPREATERALLDAQRPKVDEVARSLAGAPTEKPPA
jgi:hypothetical protein